MLPAEDRLDRVLLGLEDARRAGVDAHLLRHRRLLDDGAVRREVAAQHAQAALGVVGVVERVHDAAVAHRGALSAISPGGLPADGQRVARDEPALVELAA